MGWVKAGWSCSLCPNLRNPTTSMKMSFPYFCRYSTANSMHRSTSSGRSPFTWIIGAPTTLPISVQYTVDRLCEGGVVNPIWLFTTMWITPPTEQSCRSCICRLQYTTPWPATAASPWISTGTTCRLRSSSPICSYSWQARARPQTNGLTASRCEGLGSMLSLIFLPPTSFSIVSPMWYFTSPVPSQLFVSFLSRNSQKMAAAGLSKMLQRVLSLPLCAMPMTTEEAPSLAAVCTSLPRPQITDSQPSTPNRLEELNFSQRKLAKAQSLETEWQDSMRDSLLGVNSSMCSILEAMQSRSALEVMCMYSKLTCSQQTCFISSKIQPRLSSAFLVCRLRPAVGNFMCRSLEDSPNASSRRSLFSLGMPCWCRLWSSRSGSRSAQLWPYVRQASTSIFTFKRLGVGPPWVALDAPGVALRGSSQRRSSGTPCSSPLKKACREGESRSDLPCRYSSQRDSRQVTEVPLRTCPRGRFLVEKRTLDKNRAASIILRSGLSMILLLLRLTSPKPSFDRVYPELFFQQPYPYEIYSGFLEVSLGNKIHYLFYSSQGNPKKDPLVLFLEGGPGCSSLIGAFNDVGPLRFDDNSTKLSFNNNSWNKRANLLFLESPTGVGFSSGKTNHTDQSATDDNLQALVVFFSKFPEFTANEFYIAGQGYAGVYVPYLALAIHNYNLDQTTSPEDRIHMQGIIVGNPCTLPGNCIHDPPNAVYPFETYQFLYDRFFIEETEWQQFRTLCTYDFHSETCQAVRNQLFKRFEQTGADLTDIYNKCYRQKIEPPPLKYLQCMDQIGLFTFFNNYFTRRAFNLPANGQWQTCNPDIYESYKRSTQSSYFIYPTLVKAGYRVLVYSGDSSGINSQENTIKWLEKLRVELNLQFNDPFRVWKLGDVTAGTTFRMGGVTFASIRNAGFFAARKRPQFMERMLSAFLNGTAL